MEKSLQEIYFQFLEKKIIVGEDILEIHSRHREDGNLAEDINKLNYNSEWTCNHQNP